MVARVPIARGQHWQPGLLERGQIVVEHSDHLIAPGHRQTAAGKEI
jgi:hypothetical protein